MEERTVRSHAPPAPTRPAGLNRRLIFDRRYAVIQRLINDRSPENRFRQNVYTSITGGGGTSSSPLFFVTDSYENRSQRHAFGGFLGLMGLVSRGDWVVTVHTAGELYRYVYSERITQLLQSVERRITPLGRSTSRLSCWRMRARPSSRLAAT
jgi:hypothetical protein